MAATSLSRSFGEEVRIVYLRSGRSETESFYGSVTAPSAYQFLRMLGLDEPTLFLKTQTSFSFGTYFKNWVSSRSWFQCHHQPFQIFDGVPMLHHLIREEERLQPMLISAQAGLLGRFAHPPKDPANPLSRAEYGYQFSTDEWVSCLEAGLSQRQVEVIDIEDVAIKVDGQKIIELGLGNEGGIVPDLVIDCSGTARDCLSAMSPEFMRERSVSFKATSQRVPQLGQPLREVQSSDLGWTSKTHLQDRDLYLEVTKSGEVHDGSWCQLDIGCLEKAWIGNCVAIGQTAAVLEPLTPAPMVLLQRDIERLLELIPVSQDHSVERREFNRRFAEDVSHSDMFQKALFVNSETPDSDYWVDVAKASGSSALLRKTSQFEHRGFLVKYDLEPFNDEDWTIAHIGMGRYPKSYDRQVERTPKDHSAKYLAKTKMAIQDLLPRIPPHHVYVTNMKRYFEKQNYV